jgi:hypothetical protein
LGKPFVRRLHRIERLRRHECMGAVEFVPGEICSSVSQRIINRSAAFAGNVWVLPAKHEQEFAPDLRDSIERVVVQSFAQAPLVDVGRIAAVVSRAPGLVPDRKTRFPPMQESGRDPRAKTHSARPMSRPALCSCVKSKFGHAKRSDGCSPAKRQNHDNRPSSHCSASSEALPPTRSANANNVLCASPTG